MFAPFRQCIWIQLNVENKDEETSPLPAWVSAHRGYPSVTQALGSGVVAALGGPWALVLLGSPLF